MLQVTGTSNQAELARFLSITLPAVNKSLRHQTLPELWYFKIGYMTNCRIEWLESGEGKQYRGGTETMASLPRPVQELVEYAWQVSDLGPVLAVMKILRHGDENMRKVTIAFIQGQERLFQGSAHHAGGHVSPETGNPSPA